MVKHVSPPHLTDVEATKLVTLVFSAYSFSQFGTNIIWGQLSDRLGRRPVMLFGLTSVLVSTIGFAFSTSVASIFVFRIAAGLLSGNIVITRTMIGDMVHGHENKARAFAWNQTAYQIGTVIGPFIGGYLVQPCMQVPKTLVQREPSSHSSNEETAPLLQENHYESLQSSEPSTSSSSNIYSTIFSSEVFHVSLSYGFMALHTICFDQMLPVFLATRPFQDQGRMPSSLVYSLLYPKGGLGYSSTTVASFVSISGLLSIALMVFIFPPVDTFFGSLYCMRASLLAYPILYVLVPYLVLLPALPTWIRLSGVTLIFALKALAAVFSFNDNAILLNAAAPSPQALGLVNGMAQTAANGARALGPAAMGLFIGLGDQSGSNAFGWWFLAVVGAVGAVQGFWVSDVKE